LYFWKEGLVTVLPFLDERRHFAEAGFGAALTAFFSLIGLYMPFLSFLSGFLTPLPLVYLVRKYNLQTGVITLVVASVLIFLSTGSFISAMLLTVNFGFIGLLIGLLFKNYVPAGRSIFIISITATLLTLAGILVMARYGNVNIFAMGNETERILEQIMQFYRENNIINDLNNIEARVLIEDLIRTSILLLPGSIVLWSVTSASLTYLLSRFVLKQLNYEVVVLPAFSEWRIPWYSVWAIIIGLLLTIGGDELGLQAFAVLGKNILFVFSFVFALVGISVLTYLYKHVRMSIMIKIIVLFLLFLYIPGMLLVVVALGVLEPLVGIRDRISKEEK